MYRNSDLVLYARCYLSPALLTESLELGWGFWMGVHIHVLLLIAVRRLQQGPRETSWKSAYALLASVLKRPDDGLQMLKCLYRYAQTVKCVTNWLHKQLHVSWNHGSRTSIPEYESIHFLYYFICLPSAACLPGTVIQ